MSVIVFGTNDEGKRLAPARTAASLSISSPPRIGMDGSREVDKMQTKSRVVSVNGA